MVQLAFLTLLQLEAEVVYHKKIIHDCMYCSCKRIRLDLRITVSTTISVTHFCYYFSLNSTSLHIQYCPVLALGHLMQTHCHIFLIELKFLQVALQVIKIYFK